MRRHVFRQVKGASKGSPCAPIPCGCVAAIQELLFRENYSTFLHSSRLFLCTVCYVDNRVFLSADPAARTVPWQVYMSETFYGDYLLLEHVGDEPLLGFRIDTAQRSITMRMPVHASQFRSPLSASQFFVICDGRISISCSAHLSVHPPSCAYRSTA